MTDLLARLEVAKAGSRELDFWCAYESGQLDDLLPKGCSRIQGGRREVVVYDRDGRRSGWVGYHCFDPVTTSLDAALALAERVLPGWDFIVGRTNGGMTIHAQVGPGKMQFGNTPALALCIAILRATHKAEGAEG